MKKVAVIMGSDSDLPIAEQAAQQLRQWSIPFSVRVMSAHRTPAEAGEFARQAAGEGYGVIIAIAGMAAHLAGAIAANTVLPVIGVPTGATMNGLDALLATVQMPSGIPVATVAVGGGKNAAVLAAQMLALSDAELAEKLAASREEMAAVVRGKDRAISARFDTQK